MHKWIMCPAHFLDHWSFNLSCSNFWEKKNQLSFSLCLCLPTLSLSISQNSLLNKAYTYKMWTCQWLRTQQKCVKMRVGPLYANAKMSPQGKLNLHQKAVKLKYIICLGCCIDNHRPMLIPLLSKWQQVDWGTQIITESSAPVKAWFPDDGCSCVEKFCP